MSDVSQWFDPIAASHARTGFLPGEIPPPAPRSINNWVQTSPFVFRDTNTWNSLIGVVDDYGTLSETPVADIIYFLLTDGEAQ